MFEIFWFVVSDVWEKALGTLHRGTMAMKLKDNVDG